jgi:hypothetical protein
MLNDDMRQRLLKTAMLHLLTIEHVVSGITNEQATTLRDGADGWNTVEILCHLRDFDVIFRERAECILAQDEPPLIPVDHEALVIKNEYAKQELAQVLAELRASREATIALFERVSDDQWSRAGIHPERGRFSLEDALLQVVTHDADHTEQITRVLAGS